MESIKQFWKKFQVQALSRMQKMIYLLLRAKPLKNTNACRLTSLHQGKHVSIWSHELHYMNCLLN